MATSIIGRKPAASGSGWNEALVDNAGRLQVNAGALTGSGSVLFVDGATGDDTDAGAADSPLATISAALALQPDVILIAPGVYREALTIAQSVSLRSWRAAAAASTTVPFDVDVRGSVQPSAWTLDSGVVWKQTLTTAPTALYFVNINEDESENMALPWVLQDAAVSRVALDSAAGWYYNSGTKVLYFRMADDSDPNDVWLEIATTGNGLIIDAADSTTEVSLHAHGLTFSGWGTSGVKVWSGDQAVGSVILDGCTLRYSAAGLSARGQFPLTLTTCTAYGNTGDGFGIYAGCLAYLTACDGAFNARNIALGVNATADVTGGVLRNASVAGISVLTKAKLIAREVLCYDTVLGITVNAYGASVDLTRCVIQRCTVGVQVVGAAVAVVDRMVYAQGVSIVAATYADGHAVLDLSAAHGGIAGDLIVVAGVTDTDYNGSFTILSATSEQITYTDADPGGSSSGGTVTLGFNGTDEAVDSAAGGRLYRRGV